MEGQIKVRSLTLKIWSTKLITLELNRHLLTIQGKSKKKLFDLDTYNIKELEKKDNKFCFMLISTSKLNKRK